jgi:putative ABC transport system permease protein
MLQDLRHTWRAIARTRVSTAVILLSLGLGTGVNAAVYHVLSALLLRGPAGVGEPSRLVDIYTAEFSGLPYGPSSFPDFLSMTATSSLAAVAAIDDNRVENVRIGSNTRSARIAAVSDSYFPTLQIEAHTGRLLDERARSRQPAAAVISYSLAEELGGAATVAGQALIIGERPFTIVGVAPPRFRGLHIGRDCGAWILMTEPPAGRGDRRLSIVGRLAASSSIRQSAEDLRRISQDLASRYPDTNRGNVADPGAPRQFEARRYSRVDPAASNQSFVIGAVVSGAAILLLAAACLNVGSLLLSRAVARAHELSIKMALGATRGRLIRQLLTETICLSVAGGTLGLLFALWTTQAMPALFMEGQAELLDTRFEPFLILLTVGVATAAGALFGMAPALQGTGSPAVTALRGDAGGISAQRGGSRLRALLVGAQIAVSSLLLLTTGLLVTTLARALEGDAQSSVNRVAFVSIDLPGRYADPVRGIAQRDRLLDRAMSLDRVDAVGWASTLPLGLGNRRAFRIEGHTAETKDFTELDTNVVSAGYFKTMGIPCIEGRVFDSEDRTLARPVVVVDELLARRYFGSNALGRELVDAAGGGAKIVGIVRSGKYRTLQGSAQPTVYYPMTQDYLWRGHLLLRTSGDPAAVLKAIAAPAEEAAQGGGAVLRTATLATYLSESLVLDRLTTILVGICGLIALAMSAIGAYGVMSDTVERRTREIGLRAALGAGRVQVVQLVFAQVVRLAAAGVVAGALAAHALTYIARSFVAIVPSLDLATAAVVSGALALVVAVAAIVPLQRALRVNPNIALRAE